MLAQQEAVIRAEAEKKIAAEAKAAADIK